MSSRRLTLDDLDRLDVPNDPAISPDGGTVVYGLRRPDTGQDRDTRSLWIVSAAGGDARELTRGPADASPRWSPDGTRLAFLRQTGVGPGKDRDQLHLLAMTGPGEPEQITELPFGAGAAVWCPDGTRIAFVAPRNVGVDSVGDGVGGDENDSATPDPHTPVVIDRLGYKADGAGLLRSLRPHVHVLDLADGSCRAVTDGEFSVGTVAWHPDGRRLAFSADDLPDADRTGVSAVFVVDLDEPAAGHHRVGPVGGQIGPVSWPVADRGPLAVGRLDTEVGHADLLLLVAATADAAVANLTGVLDRNVLPGAPGYPGGAPHLESDGTHLLYCARDAGCTHLYRVPVNGGTPPQRVLCEPDESVSGLSVAAGAPVAACVLAGPDSYGDVVLLDTATGERSVLTDHTARSLPDVALFTAEPRTFTVGDSTTVHGWLLRDPVLTEPGPLLLDAHGGPHNAWSPVPDLGHGYHQALVSQGWSVLMLNVRASDGYGAEHFTRNVGSWGHGDQADFLDPVDALVAEGIADPDRLAVTGYSYGGYATCWLTGHTDRFAAAVGGGVVADTVSELASDAGHPLLGATLGANAWESAEALRAQSPMESVGRVRTPTLLLHGADDDRCPPGQAEQWFAALRAQGVPTRLVLYPGASHLFILEGRPSHRRDYSTRLIDWVTTYCTGKAMS